MLNVYLIYVYSDLMSHVEKIKQTNPDRIICFANEEYEVDSIFKDFIAGLYPWLVENNKVIDILAPGFDRQINDRVFVHKSYGFYLYNRDILLKNEHVDFTNIRKQADKLYTLYCNRGSDERLRIIDTFAREKMIDQGIITFRGIYYHEDYNNLWQYHDGSPLVDEEDFELIKHDNPDHEPNMFPKSFFRGFMDVVCESRIDDLEFFATEKTGKSIVAEKPFLVLSCQHYHRYLHEEYGVEPYSEIFDYSFDASSDINDRIEGIVANVKKLATMDKDDIYNLIADKLIRNKYMFNCYVHSYNNMVPRAVSFFNEVPYTLHGDTFVINHWMTVGKKYEWLK